MIFKKYCFILIIIQLFLFWCINCTHADEVRAMWITRYQMDSTKKIDRFINSAKVNGFNTIFVQVLGRGIAFYNSNLIPMADLSFDSLAYCVEKSHIAGLKVHAWLNAYYVWSNKSDPANQLHVANKYPQWVIFEGNSRYLDPSLKEVQNYLFDVYMEVAGNYDVDGIHLDYIRYPNISSGFDYLSRRKFSNSYWIDPLYLVNSPQSVKDYYGEDGFNKLMNKWTDYRCNNVSELVARIYKGIKSMNKNIQVSAAVFPDLNSAKKERGQDWAKWVKDGSVDFVVPMVYSDKLSRVKELIKKMACDPNSKKNLIGLGAYKVSFPDLLKQINFFRNVNKYYGSFAGFTLFSYDSISAKKWYLEKIKKHAFKS